MPRILFGLSSIQVQTNLVGIPLADHLIASWRQSSEKARRWAANRAGPGRENLERLPPGPRGGGMARQRLSGGSVPPSTTWRHSTITSAAGWRGAGGAGHTAAGPRLQAFPETDSGCGVYGLPLSVSRLARQLHKNPLVSPPSAVPSTATPEWLPRNRRSVYRSS